MKRRQQVLRLVELYKEHKTQQVERILEGLGVRFDGNFEVIITSERLFEFLQSAELPPSLAHFKRKSKQEIALLLNTHLNEKERKGRITLFFF